MKALMCEYDSLALLPSADSLSDFTGTKTKYGENNTGSGDLSSPTCIAQSGVTAEFCRT